MGNIEKSVAWFQAAASNDPLRVEAALAAGLSVRFEDSEGRPPLFVACQLDSPDALAALLRAGADPDGGARGVSALCVAAGKGHADCVKRLLEAGADVDSKKTFWGAGGTGRLTPAMHAAAMGQVECLSLLVAAGADLSLSSPYGQTPLMIAAEKSDLRGFEFLLAAGADMGGVDKSGRTLEATLGSRLGRYEAKILALKERLALDAESVSGAGSKPLRM